MEKDIAQMVKYTRLAYERGYVGGTGGNTSVRIGDAMYITQTGAVLGEVCSDQLVKVPLGVQYSKPGEGKGAPSKEYLFHQKIFEIRQDINVVLHLHPVDCIAAILLLKEGEPLPVYVPGHLKKLGRPPQLSYFPAGSRELAEGIADQFAQNDCVWLRRHGIVTGGKDAQSAFSKAEDMIDSSSLHLALRGHGALTPQQIEVLL